MSVTEVPTALDLDGVAVITGGGSGFGLNVATRLVSEGMRVALLDVSRTALKAAETSLTTAGASRDKVGRNVHPCISRAQPPLVAAGTVLCGGCSSAQPCCVVVVAAACGGLRRFQLRRLCSGAASVCRTLWLTQDILPVQQRGECSVSYWATPRGCSPNVFIASYSTHECRGLSRHQQGASTTTSWRDRTMRGPKCLLSTSLARFTSSRHSFRG